MVRRAVLWTLAGQAISFVLSFFGSIAIARLLSPYELGVYAVAMATVGILQLIATFGVGTYVVREAELTDATLNTAFTVNALLSIGLSILVAGASIPAAMFLREPGVAPVLQLLSLSPLIGIPAFRSTVMLQREMRFGPLSAIGVAGLATSTFTTLGAAALGASYMSPAYGSIASAIVGTLGTIAAAPAHVSFRTSLVAWRPIAKFGVQIMSIGGIAVAAGRLSEILIGRLLGLSALGLMSRASSLSNIINTYIYSSAMRVVYAKLAKDFRERGVVRDTFIPGLRMIVAVIGPMMIGMAVLAPPLIRTLYGEKWMAAAPILTFFMIAQFLSLTFAMNWELYIVRSQMAVQVKFEFARSLFGVVSQVVGCLFGIIGAAASSIVTAIFSMCLYIPRMGKLAESSSRELTAIYVEALAITSAACLPSLCLMYFRGWSPHTSLAEIAAAVALGAAMWLALIATTAHPLAQELRHLWSALAGKLRLATGRAE